jgi:hypothetical protein
VACNLSTDTTLKPSNLNPKSDNNSSCFFRTVLSWCFKRTRPVYLLPVMYEIASWMSLIQYLEKKSRRVSTLLYQLLLGRR